MGERNATGNLEAKTRASSRVGRASVQERRRLFARNCGAAGNDWKLTSCRKACFTRVLRVSHANAPDRPPHANEDDDEGNTRAGAYAETCAADILDSLNGSGGGAAASGYQIALGPFHKRLAKASPNSLFSFSISLLWPSICVWMSHVPLLFRSVFA